MAGPLVVSILTKQYAKLLGELESTDRPVMDTDGVAAFAAFDEAVYQAASQKREIEEKLAAVETVIWMFDADWDPSAIRPNYPRERPAKLGAISRAAYGILRDAKVPMTTRDIARVVAFRLGYEKPEERDIGRIDSAVNLALTKRVGVTLQIVGKNPIYWELIPRDKVHSRRPAPRISRAA